MEPHDNDECNPAAAAQPVQLDWEATYLIYSDAKTSWKLEQQQQPADDAQHASSIFFHDIQSLSKANSAHPHNTTTSTSSSPATTNTTTLQMIGYGSIDLAMAIQEITFARYERSYGEDENNAHYRFWTSYGPMMIRLVFEYHNNHNNTELLGKTTQEGNGGESDNDGDAAALLIVCQPMLQHHLSTIVKIQVQVQMQTATKTAARLP